MNTAPRIGEPFASVLRANRERFNSLFAQARRLHPALDGDAFAAFLATNAAPVVAAVATVAPGAALETGTAAYEIGLELVGQGLAGPCARQPFVNEGWQRLLPAAAPAVAAAPARVLGAVSNALHGLGQTPDARPSQWLTEMCRLAPQVQGHADTFLKLGQVVAWCAGLAHFRSGALAIADTLPEALALLAMDAPAGADWPTVRGALHADPWFAPGQAGHGVRVVGRAGTFRGFGGLFTRPPLVASDGEKLLVRSGGECWLLTADAFGATFHRAGSGEFDAAAARYDGLPGVRVDDAHHVLAVHGQPLPFFLPGPVTAIAATAATLALTTAHSHAVLLVALLP